MEALVALGLACNILDNIDRACKYVKKTKEIYDSASGQSADHKNLTEVVDNMTQVVEEFKELQPQVLQSKADHNMQRIIQQSLELSIKINAVLTECLPKPGKSVASAIKATIRAGLKKSELDAFEERLRKNSESLNQFVVTRTLQNVDTLKKLCSRLDAKLEFVREKQFSSDKALESITAKLEAMNLDTTTLSSQFRDIINSVDQAADDVNTASVLQALHFGTMHRRYNEVSKSEVGTFEWIFKDPNRQLQEQPGLDIAFPDWLRAGQGVFHIAGKPGSGKSTLMKFICQHANVDHLLKEWAGSRELISAQFFFWKIGTTEQKGLAGLIRGLLFTVIEKEPALAKILFPAFWHPKRHRSSLNPLTDEEVTEALDILTKDQDLLKKYRICFFVDALDEYEPQRGLTHQRLVDKILQWASESNGNVKFCVSSREEPVFEKFFSSNQRITIHNFTKPDIEELVRVRLVENEHFAALKQDHDKRCERIIKTVISEAEGVFLWVVLLLAQFEESLNEDDSIYVLEGILRRAPTELQEFFKSILHSIPERYREASYTLLAFAMRFHGIFLNSPEWVLFDGLELKSTEDTVLDHDGVRPEHAWWLFEICDRRELTKLPTDIPWHNDYYNVVWGEDFVRQFSNKVKSRCKGLLSCPDPGEGWVNWAGYKEIPHIVFTHRSIPEALGQVFAQSTTSFQLHDQLVVERWVWACLALQQYPARTYHDPYESPRDIPRSALAVCRQNRWKPGIQCRTFHMLHLMERLFIDEARPAARVTWPRTVLVTAANLGLHEYISWALDAYPAFYRQSLPSVFARYLDATNNGDGLKGHRYAEVEVISLFLGHGSDPNTNYEHGNVPYWNLKSNETPEGSYHGYTLPMTCWYYWLVFYLLSGTDCFGSIRSPVPVLKFKFGSLYDYGSENQRWEGLVVWLTHNIDPDVTFHLCLSEDEGSTVNDPASEYWKSKDLQEGSSEELGSDDGAERYWLRVLSADGVIYQWYWSGADEDAEYYTGWPRDLRLFMKRHGKDSMTLEELVGLRAPPNKDELIRLMHRNRRLKECPAGPAMAQSDRMEFEGPSTETSSEQRIFGDEEDWGSSFTNSNPTQTPSIGRHKRKHSEDMHHRELIPSARSANKRTENLTPDSRS